MKLTLKDFLGPKGYLAWLLIILLGLFLRWYQIGDRPLHHDESIHAMFGKYFYDFPEVNYYKYNPEYHGPTLYMVLRATYNSIGSLSDGSPRVPIAILGSLMLFIPLLFREFFKPWAFLFLTAAISLSPTLIFWSRFAREDFIVFTSMFMVFWGATKADPKYKAAFIFSGIALNLATKANVFVFVAQIIGYIIYQFIISCYTKDQNPSLIKRIFLNVKSRPLQTVLGFGIASFVYTYFITTGYRHLEGILDGIYRKSIMYWLDKHNIERIAGPFAFHFYQLSWYELLFIIAFLLHVVIFYLRGGLILRLWGAGIATIGAAFFIFYGTNPVDGFFLWKFLKLKDHFDVLIAVLLLFHPLAVTTHYLLKNNPILAFWGYFFTANFFTYSYLGEKVPWLSSYIFIPGIVFLVLFFQELFEEKKWNWNTLSGRRVLGVIATLSLILGVIFFFEDSAISSSGSIFLRDSGTLNTATDLMIFGFIGILFSYLDAIFKYLPTVNGGRFIFAIFSLFLLRMAWLTNNVHQEREIGFISQVHTTREFKSKLLAIRQLSESEILGRKLKIHVSGEPVWPGTWYFRDMPEYQYQDLKPEEFGNYDVILRTWKEDEKVPDNFVAEKINLRGWWVPDYKQMSWKNYLNMAINLQPWSGLGYSYTTVWLNKKILPAM